VFLLSLVLLAFLSLLASFVLLESILLFMSKLLLVSFFVVAGHCTVVSVPDVAGVPQLLAYGWHPQACPGAAESLQCRLCCYKTVDPGTPAPESGASHYCAFINRAFDRMMLFLYCCLY
jgi:hypothetical protein